MIADIHITEKSFGDKTLMRDVKFSVDDGEKVGVVGRNGVGKSTLFGILAGTDTDYTGEVIFRRGITVASTAQEHHGLGNQTVLSYILEGLSEYASLKKIIDEYPETMGDNMRKIEEYTQALERFDQKGFYQIEEKIGRELDNFQLSGCGERPLGSLSGGQKRLVEIVKIMHAEAHLALIDEPTNHMDYVAKQQFIDWMSSQPRQAMLIITHDRDVLGRVDRIIELKDGQAVSYRGNYDAYLKQNAQATAAGMNNFEQVEKRMTNLRQKVLDYQRLKEKSRNPGTIQKFKRLENEARAELAELSEMDKPTFWIDKDSAEQLDYKSAERYGKFKARNIRLSMKDAASRSQHVLVRVEDAAVGVGERILFEGVNIDLREGEAVELRGRNGAGKTTLIRMLLGQRRGSDSSLSDKSIVLRTALPDAFDVEETAGSRAAVTILDPFCGTGTVLQEALLAGYDVVGTDLSQKMVDYTTENLSWLQSTFTAPGNIIDIHQADATTHRWLNSESLAAIVCETYLGQPFSAPPTPQKLAAVVGNCNHIITSFLTNIRPQLAPNTPLCIAVPAWYDASGQATHLPLIKHLQQLGYHHLNRCTPLIYRRPDQVVARELLILQTT